MKHLSVTAVALAAFSLPSPALAQTATGCPGNTESTNELESQVEETMMTISCRVRMQQSIPFDLNRLEDLAGRWIDRCPDEDVPGGQTRTSFLRFARHLEELARSTFLRMRPRADAPEGAELARIERIARAAFGTRRKTLANALRHAGLGVLDAPTLAQAGVDGSHRAERLAPASFRALALALEGDA